MSLSPVTHKCLSSVTDAFSSRGKGVCRCGGIDFESLLLDFEAILPSPFFFPPRGVGDAALFRDL